MHHLIIRCARPSSLSEQDLWAWLDEKADLLRESGVTAVAIGGMQPMGDGDTGGKSDVVYVELNVATADVPTSILELVTDMRLLGLRPTVLTNGTSGHRDGHLRRALVVELG